MHINKKAIIEEIILYCLLIIVSVWLLQGKNDFHIDETFSYGLSNHVNGTQMLPPNDGKRFSPAEEAYYEYLTADDEWRFCYDIVWNNQEIDCHPPLYYSILHTICSVFPENFNIWYAGIINVVAVCLTLFVLRQIVEMLEISKSGKISLSLIFIFSIGIGSAICFLRMYALTMFWVILTTYIFMKTIKNKRIMWVDFVKMFLVAVCGSLTHYYYLIYLFFTCVVYLIYLFFYDKKKIVLFLTTYILAAIIAITIFPPMTFHMFENNRGKDSFENLQSFTIEMFSDRFNGMNELINTQIFGGYGEVLLIGIVLILCVVVFTAKSHRENISNTERWLWGIIIIPVSCYYLLVTQIAVYVDTRYMIPIYAVLIVMIFGIVFRMITILNNQIVGNGIIVLVGIFFVSIMVLKGEYHYRKLPDSWNSFFDENSESECIYIHDGSWRIQPSFTIIRNYDSVKFFSEEFFYEYSDEDTQMKELIVVIVNECEQEKVLKKVLELYPKLKNYEIIGGLGYAITYCFSE